MKLFPCPTLFSFPPGSPYRVTRNAAGCMVVLKPHWKSPGGNSMFLGDWLPPQGYASMAFSNRSYLSACARYWKNILTVGQRADWFGPFSPYSNGFETFMAWQKFNQGRKMVNPRIDLWDGIPPYPLAPPFYDPPSLALAEDHLWITPPSGPASALQGAISTVPDSQFVQVTSTAFYRRPGSLTQPKTLNDFHLVTAHALSGPLLVEWFPATGSGYYGTLRLTFDERATGTWTYQVQWVFPGVHGADAEFAPPTESWVTVSNSFPADGAETVHHDVNVDIAAALSGTPTAIISHGPVSWSGSPTMEIQTSGGNFSADNDQARNHRLIVQSSSALQDLWESPRRVIGLPKSNSRCIIRLTAVDKFTGSPGQQIRFMAVAE